MKPSRTRVHILFWILFVGLMAVVLRAVIFQIRPDPRLKSFIQNKSALAKKKASEDLIRSRGAILDRNGNELALSLISKSFFANPRVIENPRQTALKISRHLGISASKVENLLSSNKFFVWIKREVDPVTAKKVENLDIPGLQSSKESKRIYPHGELARSILGISGRDGLGLEGVEKSYDRWLQTSDSAPELGLRDAMGRLLMYQDYEKEWFEAFDVVLSIDVRLQKLLEDEILQGLRSTGALSAQAIMMDPKTGGILAMASLDREKQVFRNRIVSDLYEPGSTFKALTALAGLEKLHMTPDSQIYAENGLLRVGPNTVREFNGKKFEWLTLTEMLQHSSNIAAAKVGMKLGEKGMYEMIDRLGFGKVSGMDLPGEAKGIVRPAKEWRPIDLANISFGQGIAVTPLQMARMFSVIANGGYLVTPHVVERIQSDGDRPEVVWRQKIERQEVVKPEIARTLTEMLSKVTDVGGTGFRAQIPGFKIAGKTGTSQKIVEHKLSNGKISKGYSSDQLIVSFMGFVPIQDPAFVLLVIYDEPSGDVSGGLTAAPSFQRIASKALGILGVKPKSNVKEAEPMAVNSEKLFVGKSFQQVLEEIQRWDEPSRAKVELYGFGRAVREEVNPSSIRVYFE